MKALIVLLLCLPVYAQNASDLPAKITDSRTVIIGTYWPEADPREKMEVQHEGEQFIRKWGRFTLVDDVSKADLAVVIVVRPLIVQPGFWQRLAAAYASQSQTYCNTNAQNYGGMVQASTSCTTYSGNQALAQQALLPSQVLGGSILVLDAKEVRKDMAAGFTVFTGNAKPLVASFADGGGYAPLRGAAKRLKKLISAADKAKYTPPKPKK